MRIWAFVTIETDLLDPASLLIRAPFDAGATIKQLPAARWDRDLAVWIVPAVYRALAARNLEAAGFDVYLVPEAA